MTPEEIVEKLNEAIEFLPLQEEKAKTFWSMLESAQVELAAAIDAGAQLAEIRPTGSELEVRSMEYGTLNATLNAAAMLGIALRHFPHLAQLEIEV